MKTKVLTLSFLFLSSLASADQGFVARMQKELPPGEHFGKAGCVVRVSVIGSYLPIYFVEISKPGKDSLRFKMSDRNTLGLTDAQTPSYVGDASGIAGIRTWLQTEQASTHTETNSLQILVSASGEWIVRSARSGSVSCTIQKPAH